MTDKKFTVEEIIKALECCKNYDCSECIECPLHGKVEDCIETLCAGGLDLINRQKAEIERLYSEVKEKTETIDFLKDQAVGFSIDFCNLKVKLNTARAEAVKEFAEKVDDMLWQIKVESLNKGEDNKTCEIAHIRLQNLVKEKVGEK